MPGLPVSRTTLAMEVTPAIILNGSSHPLAAPTTLSQLLEQLGLTGKPVVVELNTEPVLPRHYPETPVHPGDQLEIVTLAAGG